jgi:hypothetical protein
VTDTTKAETSGADPVFPPGRYGRRRAPRRRRGWLPVIAAVLAVTIAILIAVRLYRQYGNPLYDAAVIRVTELADDHVTVEFQVTVPAGGSASCTVRARATSGAEVGRETIDVRAEPGQTRAVAVHRLATTQRARVAEVPGCGPVR